MSTGWTPYKVAKPPLFLLQAIKTQAGMVKDGGNPKDDFSIIWANSNRGLDSGGTGQVDTRL